MRKTILIGLLLVGVIFAVSAQQAVIREVNGKVEIQPPGRSWTAARAGMRMDLSSMISTGFGASAILDIGDAIINVGPITRLSLNELNQRDDTVTTSLSLRVGRIETEVKSTAGIRNNFQIRSPYSTASVRGTKWIQTLNRVDVIDGVVAVYLGPPPETSRSGKTEDTEEEADEAGAEETAPGRAPVLVGAGGSAEISVPIADRRRPGTAATPRIASGENTLQAQANTRQSNKPTVVPPGDGSGDGGGRPAPPPPVAQPVVTTGSVSVTWTW